MIFVIVYVEVMDYRLNALSVYIGKMKFSFSI